jgi:hypothetical protein
MLGVELVLRGGKGIVLFHAEPSVSPYCLEYPGRIDEAVTEVGALW